MMKNTAATWAVAGLLVLGLAGAANAAAGKTAVVDMARLIKAHPDARTAEVTMKKYMDEFEADQKKIMEDADKLKAEFETAREESMNKALSDEGRERKKKDAEEKIGKIREFELKAREQLGMKQKQLNEQHRRLREAIVAKLQKVIKEYADKNGYSLVLNSSGAGTGAEAVVYSAGGSDITGDIIKQIGGDTKDLKD